MIVLKNADEQQRMRSAGRVAARVLRDVCKAVQPGVSTREIDLFAAEKIRSVGAKSAFLGYRGYPCHVCISVNDEVVHGLAGARRLRFGDIVSLDVGVVFEGFIGDNARTVAVGGCDVGSQRLLDVTEQALHHGISRAVPGNRVTHISRAVQQFVESEGYSVVREFVGHGVGRSMHEEPQIPNYVDAKCRQLLKAGMTLAIEPMVNAGRPGVRVLKDGWTAVTQDGSWSAHFEHTVLVTEGAAEILTRPD